MVQFWCKFSCLLFLGFNHTEINGFDYQAVKVTHFVVRLYYSCASELLDLSSSLCLQFCFLFFIQPFSSLFSTLPLFFILLQSFLNLPCIAFISWLFNLFCLILPLSWFYPSIHSSLPPQLPQCQPP